MAGYQHPALMAPRHVACCLFLYHAFKCTSVVMLYVCFVKTLQHPVPAAGRCVRLHHIPKSVVEFKRGEKKKKKIGGITIDLTCSQRNQ